jgi:hypothetical protein
VYPAVAYHGKENLHSYHPGNYAVDQILMRMLEWQNRFVDLGCWFAGRQEAAPPCCVCISRG